MPEQPNNAATFAVDIWDPMKALSASLAAMTNTGSFNPTTGVFSAGPGPGPTVWNLTTAQLASFTANMAFPSCFSSVPNPPSCDGVVNVTGSSYTSAFTFNPLFPLPGIIFNFSDATSVNIDNAWEASILAPNANVQSSSFIEGNVVANSIGGTVAIGAEIHNHLFDCSDNLCTPTQVPEPGSWAVLGSALAMFAHVSPLSGLTPRGSAARTPRCRDPMVAPAPDRGACKPGRLPFIPMPADRR